MDYRNLEPNIKRIVRDALESKIVSVTTLAWLYFFLSMYNALSATAKFHSSHYGWALIYAFFSFVMWLMAAGRWDARKEAKEKLSKLDGDDKDDEGESEIDEAVEAKIEEAEEKDRDSADGPMP